MSQQTPNIELNPNDSVSGQEIIEIASLARLGINEDTAKRYADDITKVLTLMKTLSDVDTTGIQPLSNIHEVCYHLRADIADHNIDRARNQSMAPAVEDGLYLVPQVIE
jgi:aspartyl-tRNA(Asn)/glutamyl-tRNA(Gln) amidotransferase subunit C